MRAAQVTVLHSKVSITGQFPEIRVPRLLDSMGNDAKSCSGVRLTSTMRCFVLSRLLFLREVTEVCGKVGEVEQRANSPLFSFGTANQNQESFVDSTLRQTCLRRGPKSAGHRHGNLLDLNRRRSPRVWRPVVGKGFSPYFERTCKD